ncbi:hypothetical protein [Bizionia arctica]|uniref:hypothetical protein n=1 Tax=Bizionia arctica TaxID=1495645 RepID=UPI0016697C00|nr:hypothetical protein [Bizionia arctica]
MGKKKQKKEKKKALKALQASGMITDKVKSSCCEKFKKKESKRCKKCPCFDLLKKVA